MKNLVSFLCYWIFSLVPKNKNLWAFSGFGKRAYMDNSKYLFEWILENHPEINAKWFTVDNEVYRQLSSEGKPVVYMKSFQGVKYMSQAAIAVTDHFVMSDYDMRYGFNNRTKVVQLWHGVGNKAMVRTEDGGLKNTTVPGVIYSDDILINRNDPIALKIKKRLKYFRYAHSRELFEEYFMLVCPGMERILKVADVWNVPRKVCFKSGHPRNIKFYEQNNILTRVKVLYAPTYRWNSEREQELVDNLIVGFEIIEKCMEEVNGEFVIRLHPHTWRNYIDILESNIKRFKHLRLDKEKDIYQTLNTYSILITDYSSIAYDFVLLDRPIIFHIFDIDDFQENECEFNYDYEMFSPGEKSRTWQATLSYVCEYLKNPSKDSQWRCMVRDEFYDMSVNDIYNSERIVNEIKKRLM